MSEEFDIFATAVKPAQPQKPAERPHDVPRADKPRDDKPANREQNAPKKNNFRREKDKSQMRDRRRDKQNASPIRGENGTESVNPLLNARLPQSEGEKSEQSQFNFHRDPSLPEYRLADIQTWTSPQIVDEMMPNADPEELGGYRKHELIFAAIRQYIASGGAVLASGCLEIMREGHGFLRSSKNNFLACPEDVFVTQQQIRRYALRTGDEIEGPIREARDRDRFFCLGNVNTVNGKEPSVAARVVHFENLTPTFPTRRIVLETAATEYSTRVVDMFTPIGFGQRGLIVAPPRVGKTVLLQKIANAITTNHPAAKLIILLVDERPEEVTDMQRNTKALVLSSTFDEEPQHHVNVADMVIEMSKRQAENGKDVIILLDSITRLARAYNTVQPHSGKILTGGVDALALHRPKRFFGAARNIENGGSLTILATALIDTGSRMDEVIFEEFKGTGNMELVLDRSLADKRIFPAIDVGKSGTRKEDLLLDPLELEKTWGLRRVLAEAGPERAMKSLLNSLKKTKSNPEFLLALDLKRVVKTDE